MGDKGRKKGQRIPFTGILVCLVAVLVVCACILAWFFFHAGESGSRKSQDSFRVTELETGVETRGAQEAAGTETEPDTEAESAQDTEEAERGTGRKETELLMDISLSSEEKASEQEGTASQAEQGEESGTGTESGSEKPLTVAIDPGHQGSWVDMSALEPSAPGSSERKAKATAGTQGRYSGKAEYELNLEISLLLREELTSRGYRVVMTREDHDTAISNAERALLAYEEGGDIYVRIHANGSTDSSVNGALAMVPSSANPYVGSLAADSYLLGDCILRHYCEKASFASQGVQYYDNMTGINWSKLPVMILEMGFMSNQSDDLRMADASVQAKMAEGIADGIDEYFTRKGLKEEKVAPEDAARMNALLEQLGEDSLYPAMDSGEAWAVSVKNLETGAAGDIHGDVQMASASVVKVFLMAAIYDRVCYPSSEERRIIIEETYDGELKQLITDMITVSDNTAANTLLTRLGGGDASAGMDVVNQFCEENGYTATVMGRKFLEENPSGDNLTSANDCRRLLESIYRGTCVGPEASAKMYEYLKNQTRKGKIPTGLAGTGAVCANKTGELAGEYGQWVENDIAVVEDGDSAYVLCVLSGSLKDNGSAVSRIGEISRSVFEGR